MTINLFRAFAFAVLIVYTGAMVTAGILAMVVAAVKIMLLFQGMGDS